MMEYSNAELMEALKWHREELARVHNRHLSAALERDRLRHLLKIAEAERDAALAVIARANRETDSFNHREAGGWQAVVDRVQDILAEATPCPPRVRTALLL